MPRRAGFTAVEVLLVIVGLVVLLAILLPVLRRDHYPRTIHNHSQTRGIHQSMIMYAQDNGGYFPGLDADGETIDLSVEHRFQILLEAE